MVYVSDDAKTMFIRENTRGEGQMFLYKDGKFTELGELAANLSSEIAANGDVEIAGVYEMSPNGRFIVGAAMKKQPGLRLSPRFGIHLDRN